MIDSKIRSGKTLLESGMPPKEVARNPGSFYSNTLSLVTRNRALLEGGFLPSLNSPHLIKIR
jgi:hypothetical protein